MSRTSTTSREGGVAALALLLALATGLLAHNHYALALIIPIGLAGSIVLLVRPVLGAFLLAGTIPLEAVLMLEGVTASKLIGIAVVGTWAAQKLFRRESLNALLSPALIQVSILFLAFACLSLIWAEYPAGLGRNLFLLAQLIVLCVVLCDLLSTWDRIIWVAKFVVLATSVAALMVAVQYFFGGARRAGGGVAGGINKTASMLVTVLPLAFFLLRSRETPFWRWLGLAYIPLAGVGVAVTLSRMNYLLFPLVVAVHLVFMARTNGDRGKVLALGFAIVVGVSFVPMDAIRDRAMTMVPYLTKTVGQDDPVEGVSARGFHLRASLAMFSDHPFGGLGYQTYPRHFLAYQARLLPGGSGSRLYSSGQNPHNSHFSLLATLGIGGGLLWAGIFATAVYYLIRSWRIVGRKGGIPFILVQSASVIVGIQFLNGFYDEIHRSKIFWLVMALTVAIYRIAKRDETYRPGPREAHLDIEPANSRFRPPQSVVGAGRP